MITAMKSATEVEGYNELVLITDIELHSHCEHHMVPFVGKAHVGYIPAGKVVGLSKIARVVDAFTIMPEIGEQHDAASTNGALGDRAQGAAEHE